MLFDSLQKTEVVCAGWEKVGLKGFVIHSNLFIPDNLLSFEDLVAKYNTDKLDEIVKTVPLFTAERF